MLAVLTWGSILLASLTVVVLLPAVLVTAGLRILAGPAARRTCQPSVASRSRSAKALSV